VTLSKAKHVQTPQGILLLRDLRERNWSWFQNELLDHFAPLIGPYAVAVYLCLCRMLRGNEATAQVSVRQIEAVWQRSGFRASLSRTSVHRSLRLLEQAGMIRLVVAGTPRQPATWGLVSLPELAGSMTVEQCDNLAWQYDAQRGRAESEGVTVGDAKTLLKSSGKACEETRISTEIPGTLMSPTDISASPVGDKLLINKRKEIKKDNKGPAARGMSVNFPSHSDTKPTAPTSSRVTPQQLERVLAKMRAPEMPRTKAGAR